VKHKAKWFNSDEMKERAVEKVDFGGLLKKADVNATVIASVIVGSDGRVECLKIINPRHRIGTTAKSSYFVKNRHLSE